MPKFTLIMEGSVAVPRVSTTLNHVYEGASKQAVIDATNLSLTMANRNYYRFSLWVEGTGKDGKPEDKFVAEWKVEQVPTVQYLRVKGE